MIQHTAFPKLPPHIQCMAIAATFPELQDASILHLNDHRHNAAFAIDAMVALKPLTCSSKRLILKNRSLSESDKRSCCSEIVSEILETAEKASHVSLLSYKLTECRWTEIIICLVDFTSIESLHFSSLQLLQSEMDITFWRGMAHLIHLTAAHCRVLFSILYYQSYWILARSRMRSVHGIFLQNSS